MTDDKPVSRRAFLKLTTGAATAVTTTSIASAKEIGFSPTPRGPEEFRVQGKTIERVKYRPTEIEATTRHVSKQLQDRYGRATFEESITYPREKSENHTQELVQAPIETDDLPKKGTEVTTKDWVSFAATEDEWRSYRETTRGTAAELSIQLSGSDTIYAEWDYKKNNGVYLQAAPMNVVLPPNNLAFDLDLVQREFGSSGHPTTEIIQYDRYAWDENSSQYKEQDQSVATSRAGTFGRQHGRLWDFDDGSSAAISGQFHEDTAVPHTVKSFETAKDWAEGVFNSQGANSANDWDVFPDAVKLGNSVNNPAPHNGQATKVTDT